MNGYNDIHTEPADDEEFALACGYEIITEDELYDIISLPGSRRSSSDDSPAPPQPPHPYSFWHRNGGNKKLPSKPSVSSFTSTSTQSSGVSSMMTKPMSSCSLSSHGTHMSEDDCFSMSDDHDDHDDDIDEAHHDYQLSVERIWSMIQEKRHHHHDDLDEGIRMADPHHQFLTMEHSSNSRKLTAWFQNLVHFPEKLRQIVANKHRFNIEKVPEEIRDELKHIYVY